MTDRAEICGDEPLGVARRLAYLWRNAKRNLTHSGPAATVRPFAPDILPDGLGIASPSRALTEAFLRQKLPALLPPGDIRVLEIGCGSGRLCRILADLGYCGTYVGVDVGDRFETGDVEGFTRQFVRSDIHLFDPGEERFDLIVSVSALEHIAEDGRLIVKLPQLLRPDGMELHFVPAGCGLAAYLWHGYRQYSRRAIGARFDGAGCIAYGLGGPGALVLHITFITIGEMILKLPVRKRFAGAYTTLRRACLRIDRVLPLCPTLYAVHRQQHRPG
ncbi:MAG: class I SAM-dependent methyltransferase [Hyphomicrobiales bacterium]|nr:class I SAM-dependent methyltransferase [Hyphomicrobiales bacterium]